MSSLYQVNAGDRILAVDNIQFYNLLKGVAASGENILLIYNAGALTFQPSSDPSAGTRVLTIKNNAGTTLFAARYDGLIEMLAAAAAPGTPVAGSVYWDTLLAALRVYDGTNWRDMAGGSTGPLPNLVLNSDFSRRTVFGLAMPEVFADLSGTTKIDGGAAGAVAANIFTQGAANNEYAWCAGSFVWRDGRASATFKAVGTGSLFALRWRISATDYIQVDNAGGTFRIGKVIAAAGLSNVATVAQAMTLNRWYWLELEKQGTTIVAKMYDTGGTASGVTKASSTLLQTLTGTVADASVQVGASISITSDNAAAQWGGIATGNGGVYVETWLPESWTGTTIFSGTLGGQAIGYDESVDAGPLGTQAALRFYIPATSRVMFFDFNPVAFSAAGPSLRLAPSTAYAFSFYEKMSGTSANGLISGTAYSRTVSGGSDTLVSMTDLSEATWTRKTGVLTTGATARYGVVRVIVNESSNKTGTAYFMLPQLEQGSAVTAWRGAPADDAPICVAPDVPPATDITTTSAAFVEADARNLSVEVFAPWDCVMDVEADLTTYNSGANANSFQVLVDGAGGGSAETMVTSTTAVGVAPKRRFKVTAGKHRVSLTWKVAAGTGTLNASLINQRLLVTMFRGK